MAVVAAGLAWAAVLRALDDLGLGEAEREALGLRLVQIGMPWPLEDAEVRRLTAGVETVLVVEDKLAFLESRVKEALYRTPAAPLVLGEHDAEGRPLRAGARLGERRRRGPRAGPGAGRRRPARARTGPAGGAGADRPRARAAARAAPQAHSLLLLGLPPQHLDPRRGRTTSSAWASAATRWSPSTAVGAAAGWWACRRWVGRGRSGSAWRRSPTTPTSSRTSATAPSTTRARSRSAPPWRPG